MSKLDDIRAMAKAAMQGQGAVVDSGQVEQESSGPAPGSVQELLNSGQIPGTVPQPEPEAYVEENRNSGINGGVGALRADAPEHPPVRPTRTSPDQVIIHCKRSIFNFFYIEGRDEKRVSFHHSYLLTDDKKLVDYIMANYGYLMTIEEQGPLAA